MAPEQARSEKRLTTAVDVYALGGVLYALLTGRPPFKAGTTLDDPGEGGDRRPRRHRRSLQPKAPADLETICLKCLRKEPGRRYASASELADDLDRFLNGEPIQARASTVWERAFKWAKRRPARAALLAVSAAASVLLVAVVFWHHGQMVRANDGLKAEKVKAERAAETAQDNAAQSRGVRHAAGRPSFGLRRRQF